MMVTSAARSFLRRLFSSASAQRLASSSAAKNFARMQGVRELVFFSTKFAKTIISRLEVEKCFFNGQKPIPVGFFTRSNSSEQNIYRNVV
jgi:uncharacterized protein YcbX